MIPSHTDGHVHEFHAEKVNGGNMARVGLRDGGGAAEPGKLVYDDGHLCEPPIEIHLDFDLGIDAAHVEDLDDFFFQ